jgi:hypothetical protein
VVVAATTPPQPNGGPMSRLSDTQLIILSAASQRDDRGVELPANVKCEAARKAADKLIRAGLRPQRVVAPEHPPETVEYRGAEK